MTMNIIEVPYSQLSVSPLNVRTHGASEGIDELAASIQARGLINPLCVRESGDDDYEIVAGQRRFKAIGKLVLTHVWANDQAVPCVLAELDDGAAIDLSLAENVDQLPMQEIDQCDAFAKLIKSGQTIDDISERFGITRNVVNKRLLLGNLIEPIKKLFRTEQLRLGEVQALSLASKKQQRDWMKLHKNHQEVRGETHIKRWIAGGEKICTDVALFDTDAYKGKVIDDFFGENQFFQDAAEFWEAQSAAIDEKVAAYEKRGWPVAVIPRDQHFREWEYDKATKKNGGWAIINVQYDGSVEIFEGRIHEKQQQASSQVDSTGAAQEPQARNAEISAKAQDYVNQHKKVAVQHALMNDPALALRIAVYKCLVSSSTWAVKSDVWGHSSEVRESVNEVDRFSPALDELLLSVFGESGVDHMYRPYKKRHILETLLAADDATVMNLLAALVAYTLEAATPLTEFLGQHLAVDMGQYWHRQMEFVELVRDKGVLRAMCQQLEAVKLVSKPESATAKVLRGGIQARLDGTGCEPVVDWLPNYFKFPMAVYCRPDKVDLLAEVEQFLTEHAPQDDA